MGKTTKLMSIIVAKKLEHALPERSPGGGGHWQRVELRWNNDSESGETRHRHTVTRVCRVTLCRVPCPHPLATLQT